MKRKIEHIPNMMVIGNAFTCKTSIQKQKVTSLMSGMQKKFMIVLLACGIN
jgi:hypothetical protein